MIVSLCMIAYNEADALSGLFKDISLQDYPHNKIEVVFVDSMSTDKTYEMMEKFKETGYGFRNISIVQCMKKNQASSWNAALMTARGDVIIRVDAHARIPKDFVSRNIMNLEDGEKCRRRRQTKHYIRHLFMETHFTCCRRLAFRQFGSLISQTVCTKKNTSTAFFTLLTDEK